MNTNIPISQSIKDLKKIANYYGLRLNNAAEYHKAVIIYKQELNALKRQN